MAKFEIVLMDLKMLISGTIMVQERYNEIDTIFHWVQKGYKMHGLFWFGTDLSNL